MTKKIQALTETIYNLENDVYPYSWTNPESCNCGVLARTIMGGKGIFESGFCKSPKLGTGGPFSEYAYCMTTNLPLPKVFQSLKDAEFTHEDLIGLEYLGNEKILKRLGVKPEKKCTGINVYPGLGHNEKENLISYLKAWVEILKEQEPVIEQPVIAIQPETKVVHVYHSVEVDRAIKEQSGEIILN